MSKKIGGVPVGWTGARSGLSAVVWCEGEGGGREKGGGREGGREEGGRREGGRRMNSRDEGG